MKLDEIGTFIKNEILRKPDIEIGPDQDLLLSDTLDSLDVVRLVSHLESETGLKIPAGDVTLENFATLRQIEAYLARRGE